MYPEADALLDAIWEHPNDDTPRLIFADWLQEHGQESYARFIRLQCAAAHASPGSDRANHLWEEIGRVWNRLDDEWWPATRDEWLVKRGPTALDAIHFDRGFLTPAVPLTYSQLVEYGRSCWPWLPFSITTLLPDFKAEQAVVELPRLSRIRHLRLAWWYDDHAIWPLIESPLLSNLEVLDLTRGVLSGREVEGMLRPGLYPRLREVRLKVFDEEQYMAAISDTSPTKSSPCLQSMQILRHRVEARFERVVWVPTY